MEGDMPAPDEPKSAKDSDTLDKEAAERNLDEALEETFPASDPISPMTPDHHPDQSS
jgi:hypothetical protein